jgi:hypothetical protein
MIAAIKQYGTNYAKRTVKRQLVRYAVLGVLVAVGFVYKLVTGDSLKSSDADETASAPAAHAPAPAANAAPITSPAAAAPITSQGIDINAPKRAAQAAVNATNAHIAAETGQPVASSANTSAPVSGPGSTPSGALPAPSGALPVVASAALTPAATGVTREVYGYNAVGRRDPFYSLILTDDLRPLLQDLRLVGILYEQSGRHAVAIMRDVQTNAQYRVANGGTLGRMRVSQIRPRAVLFTIDEFGLSRQDSLVWSDTTKVRIR